jgi:hypothetical protein
MGKESMQFRLRINLAVLVVALFLGIVAFMSVECVYLDVRKDTFDEKARVVVGEEKEFSSKGGREE